MAGLSPRCPTSTSHPRLRRGGAVATALVGLVVLLGACGSSGPPAPDITMGQQLQGPTPKSLLDAPLVSSAGKKVTLGSFDGKVVVLSDFMSLCQESCPLDTANVVAAARETEQAGNGDKVEYVSLTIDPHRDSPARLAAFRKLYAPAPADWTILTGSASVVDRIWRTLGVYIHKTAQDNPPPLDWWTHKKLTYDLSHDDDVFFFDKNGHGRFMLVGIPHVAKGAPIPKTIRNFMSDEGDDNLAHPKPKAWTVPQELRVISWLNGHPVTKRSSSS